MKMIIMKLPIAAELRGIRIKIKKKRLKAEYKIEKKILKTVEEKDTTSEPTQPIVQTSGQIPLYKDSGWLRAIIGLASLIVTIIAILITLYR